MDNTKEMSKIAFNQQALTYDKDIKGQHARTLYPYGITSCISFATK